MSQENQESNQARRTTIH